MGFGWILLINGLIGIPMFIGTWFLFVDWCIRKYGGKAFEEAMGQTSEDNQMIGERVVHNQTLWTLLAFFCTFFLWEFELPLKYYAIWDRIPKETKGEKEDVR